MATYAAVASLLQTLDYLLQFPCFLLEVKKIQAEFLRPKFDELILLLTADQPSKESSIRLLQLFEETDLFLACKVGDFVSSVKAVKEGSDAADVFIAIRQRILSFTVSSTTSTTPKFVLEGEQILAEIRFFEVKLGNFLYSIDPAYGNPKSRGLRALISDLPGKLFSAEQHAYITSLFQADSNFSLRDIVRLIETSLSQADSNLSLRDIIPLIERLCTNCQRLHDTISNFVKATAQVTNLHQDLLFLLNLLNEDPSDHKCCHDHELLKQVKDVADRVRDLVEEHIMDSQINSDMDLLNEDRSDHTLCNDQEFLKQVKDVANRARDLVEEHIMDSQINSEMNYSFLNYTLAKIFLPSFLNRFERALKQIFLGRKGIGQCLAQALKRLQLIKETIRGRNEETPSLQTSISNISLRHSNREDILVGLDDELFSLLEGLMRTPSGLEIVTILGMGGIGKTTLARKAFHHPYTTYHFYCRAWITISQVYKVRELLLGLLGSLALSTDEMVEKNDAQLAEVLYRSLKGKRYLIVMDDMWSIDAWNDVKRCFPDDKNGSRIVVTSRITKLAVYVSPKKPPHCMNLLDTEKSWQLLHKLVFGKESCPSELEKIGKYIAKRCQGLPLAIVVIAGVLARVIRTNDCWNDIAEKVSSFVSTNPEECLDILALSYNYLPQHLKACFLYMAAFPEDCEIQVQKLINLWVAEGFLDPQSSKDLEQIAEEYLEDLIGRNLVLIEKKYFGGKVKTCRLHDFLRELCLREAENENFMHVMQKRGAKCSSVSLRNQRRLSFHLDPYCDVPAAPPIPHVSSFLCFTLGTDIVPNILFFQLGFKILRVLDIFFLNFEYFPEQILKLIHLRYLALNVTYELPASVSKLRNLQTLVIHGPWHRQESDSSPTFLVEYWSMPSLRHLHCSVTIHLKNPPGPKNELPQLFVPEYLQTLSIVRFSSCTKKVFSIMPHLKKLRICETEEDYSKDRPSELLKNLHCLTELETLDCCFYKQNGEARRISCLSAFPCTLRELSLSWSYLPWEDMSSIAMLPRLEVLKLKNFAFQGPKWEPVEDGFCSLKHLLIEKTNLVHWKATIYHFPCLQHLVLKSCKLLEEVPFGVEEIGTLLRIELQYCSEATEVAAREIQEQIEGIEVVIRSDW